MAVDAEQLVLVLTAEDDATADYLCARLAASKIGCVRLDTDTFARRGFIECGPHGIELKLDENTYSPRRFSNVWYRRPRGIAVPGPYRESHRLHASREWGAAVDAFLSQIPRQVWMNHPADNSHANSKLLQLQLAREVGLSVPDTLVTRSSKNAVEFWLRLEGQVVAKPLSVGYVETATGSVEAQIFTSIVDRVQLDDESLLARCPTLLQALIPKGTDVRVTIVDRRAIALYMRQRSAAPQHIDIRKGDMTALLYEPVKVPYSVLQKLLALMERFFLRFAAIDLVESASGEWFFLEVNPNGQWAWMDLLGVSDIASEFIEAFRMRQ